MALLATVLAQRDWDGHMWGDGGWMWLWGTVMMVGVLAAVGLVIWLVVRATQSSGYAPPPASDDGLARARSILAERYARGEISTEEYQERIAGLR